MARLRSIPYNEIIPKYQTGQYSITQLSKEYNISKSTLSEYIKRENVRINEQAKEAINALDSGLKGLNKIINEQINEQSEQPLISQNNTLIVDEVISIVKDRNPQFAHMFQNLSARVLKMSDELLRNGVTNTKDLKNITSAMKDINDTLQVIPKPPAFAQQININKQSTDKNKEVVKTIEVEIIKP